MNDVPNVPGESSGKEYPHGKYITVYFSKEDFKILRKRIAEANSSYSAFVREIFLHGKINARLNEEERHFFRELISMSNDINQLVSMARKEGLAKVMLHFEQYRKKIDELINKMEHDQ